MKLYTVVKRKSDYDFSETRVIAIASEKVIAELLMMTDPDFVGAKYDKKWDCWNLKSGKYYYDYSWRIQEEELNQPGSEYFDF
jgi:hypothetical protein